ncbi:hypothetical protein HPB50_026500 [Hyalomma asiaticum]|uniref:Uncharacterized protein n=1 Tax=Hyalomma asiaticum TaxID=266040 RepID=A0ACB7SRQ3_HYAAI|nr:hypothetical protein HPB50_026500 [Hyalomma asiaticum]
MMTPGKDDAREALARSGYRGTDTEYHLLEQRDCGTSSRISGKFVCGVEEGRVHSTLNEGDHEVVRGAASRARRLWRLLGISCVLHRTFRPMVA